MEQRFRANVGVVVLNDHWEVLALERIDEEALEKGQKKGTNQWQLVQGGLDQGEEPETAWPREMWEEIRVHEADVELIGSYPEWLVYELPEDVRKKPSVQAKHGRGQVQRWFFVKLKESAKIDLEPDDARHQEFVRYKWTTMGALADETWEVRRPTYLRLALYLETMKREQERG